MKISTRLVLTKALCVGVIVLVGTVVASTDRTVREELARNATASEILSGVFGVRYLMHEYVIRHEERARVQIAARQASLSKLFAIQQDPAGPELEILARLREADATVQSIFSQIVTNYSSADDQDRKSPLFQELEERLTGQIMIRIETMIASASILAEQSRLGVLTAQNRESAAVATFGAIVLLTFAITMLIGVRSIFRPLAKLQAGVSLIGAGNFEVRMDGSGGDEISDLARAFNDMAEKLRSRDAKIRRLVDSNIIGIVISDLNGTILEANDAFLKLVGQDKRGPKSEKLHVDELAPADSRLSDIPALQELSKNGTYIPFETEFLHKDGHRVPVMIGGALIDGQPASIVSFVLDLTERKLAQEALARTQADLTHMARVSSLGALTASIAHEVSQPLSGIITNASTCLRMLAADPPNVDGARETARRTIRDGNRASDVVTRLRALFAKKEVTREPVDLNEAIREVVELLRGELRKGRVILQMELADNLLEVAGDRVQLQQVILNLIANAADAMSTVDRPRQLTIKTANDGGDCVLLIVRDTGVGITAPEAEKVFEPFYSTKGAGMGIGLSVSRSIIEGHQGRLWAERNDGPGAIFSFTIPRKVNRSDHTQRTGLGQPG